MILPNGDYIPDEPYVPLTKEQFYAQYGNQLNYDRYMAAQRALDAKAQAEIERTRRRTAAPVRPQPAPRASRPVAAPPSNPTPAAPPTAAPASAETTPVAEPAAASVPVETVPVAIPVTDPPAASPATDAGTLTEAMQPTAEGNGAVVVQPVVEPANPPATDAGTLTEAMQPTAEGNSAAVVQPVLEPDDTMVIQPIIKPRDMLSPERRAAVDDYMLRTANEEGWGPILTVMMGLDLPAANDFPSRELNKYYRWRAQQPEDLDNYNSLYREAFKATMPQGR